MLGDDRKVSPVACVLLVLLRIAIGWHLLYEGWWKINTQTTATPWTAEGYLKNATGPLRTTFRNLTGDPNDLDWLDYDKVSARLDDYVARFQAHYPGVNDKPERGLSVAERVTLLLDGPEDYRVELAQLPEGVDLSRWKNAIRFDAAKKRLIVNGQNHLLPDERDSILALAPLNDSTPAEQKDVIARFRKAVEDVFKQQAKLPIRQQLAALLKGDPDRVGVLQQKGDVVVEKRMGEIEQYKAAIDRYEANLKKTRQAFQWDHVQKQWLELQALRRKLVDPVKALEVELRTEAEKLLDASQLAKGPVPPRMTQMRSINLQTMYGLAIVGILLIAGLFTRVAALGGFGLLMMFYLAIPPWPGTPPEVGIEHNFIVNKVLVEAIACLAFVFLPSGRWFGVDAIGAALFRRKRD
ncbi:MAG TPA: DoxX family protein [Planctomycetaceae bacterium]|nr:DoxX family protein [Planctomycetaceae bacterium]